MIVQRIFPRLLLTPIPQQLLRSNLSPLMWIGVTVPPNIGEDEVKEFKYCQLEFVVCIFYHFIEDTINTTSLFGLEGLYVVP